MLRPHLPQQLDELLAGDVLLRQSEVHVVVVVGAVGPEDVQPLPPVAHAHVEPLPDQQPAGIEQIHAPDRVAGVHEVPPGCRPRLPLVSPILPHELLLLRDVRLPEEARDLVVAGSDAVEQFLDARGRVGHTEGVLDPGADLLGGVKRPPGDLLLELLDLGRSEATGITPVVQGAEFGQALVAEDAEPLPDLASGDPHQFGDLLSGPSVIAPEHRREPLEDPPVLGVSPSLADVFPLLESQPDRLHRSVPPTSRLNSPGCSTPVTNGNYRKFWTGETIQPDAGLPRPALRPQLPRPRSALPAGARGGPGAEAAPTPRTARSSPHAAAMEPEGAGGAA